MLSIQKISEGAVIAGVVYINGHIRQSTGSYNGVSALVIINCLIGLAASTYLERRAFAKENNQPLRDDEIVEKEIEVEMPIVERVNSREYKD